MTGREDQRENDLFFACSLLEYIGRKTRNHRRVVVNALGIEKIRHLLELADIYHNENMDKLLDELVEKCHIQPEHSTMSQCAAIRCHPTSISAKFTNV